jgi:hypothetical protein
VVLSFLGPKTFFGVRPFLLQTSREGECLKGHHRRRVNISWGGSAWLGDAWRWKRSGIAEGEGWGRGDVTDVYVI